MPEYKFIPREKLEVSRPKDSYAGLIYAFSFVIFLISFLAYGAAFLYKVYLERQAVAYNKAFEKIKSDIEIDSVVEIIRKSKEIDIAKNILDNHKAVSNVFKFMEENTLNNNYFTSFSFGESAKATNSEGQNKNLGNLNVTLNGVSKSYEDLAKQMEITKQSKDLNGFEFSGFKLEENGDISYNLNLMLKNSIIKY